MKIPRPRKSVQTQATKEEKKEMDPFEGIRVEKPVEKEPETDKVYNTRLRKNSSSIFSIGDDYLLPDFNNPDAYKKSSSNQNSTRIKAANSMFFYSPRLASSNSLANTNFLIGPSPRGQSRNWTPLCPSPNISDIFSRGGGSYEFKTNNEDLDNIMHQLKRKIEENS